MKLTRIAREAEEFDRAMRDGSAESAYASEILVVATASAAAAVRPDPAFSADLRASLLHAAREGALVAAPSVHPSRRTKRRWTIAAPAAAVALATGGVAFAVTGLQTHDHAAPLATPTVAASVLSTAHTQLADLNRQVRVGRPTSASLTSLRTQAIRMRSMLPSVYESGRDPQAVRELHGFALTALADLAALHSAIPASLSRLYMSTLQTLVDLATAAQSTCAECKLPPVTLPSPLASLIRVPVVAPPTVSATSTHPVTPVITAQPTTPVGVPTTVPTPSGSPTTLPLPTITLPTALPTLHF